jgi:drug/metabolite transporter (DMT)-like permease
MTATGSGRLLVCAAAVLFSTGGAAIKAVSSSGWQVAGLRSAIAFVTLLVLLPEGRRLWSWRAALVGCAYATTLITYVLANRLTTAANTIFLQSTAPLYVLVLAPWVLGERLRRADLLFMGCLAVGLLPFFASAQQVLDTAPDPALGNVLAAGAGVAWALTIVGLRWLSRAASGSQAVAAVVIGNLVAALACLPAAWPLRAMTPSDAMVVLYLGVVQIGLAYVFLTRGLRHLPAFETSLLLLAELVLNPVWAWLVHGERPGRWPLIGGTVILVATAAKMLWEGRRVRRESRP